MFRRCKYDFTVYFICRTRRQAECGVKYMDHKQSIKLKSVRNARELGGYPSYDGKIVKSGVLLRTAKLDEMTSEDIQILKEHYRVGTIIDFRMAMEIANADPMIGDAYYAHLDVIDTAVFSSQSAANIDIKKLTIFQLVRLAEMTGMLDEKMYIGFLTSDMGQKAYSQFFRILLETSPDRAVLWHCTSGKDRTGLAAMLLLAALGVDEKVIMEDYLLTNEYNADKIESTKRFMLSNGLDDAYAEKAALVYDKVDERFMQTALVYLKQTYGSVVGYIRDGLHITQDEINQLKEKYLV